MPQPKRVVFILKRMWNYCSICMDYAHTDEGDVCPSCGSVLERHDLYHDIKTGLKRVEYREAKPYWTDRLFKEDKNGVLRVKVNRAWFVVGMPKDFLPRLEADIVSVAALTDEEGCAETYAITFKNVQEITA